MEMTAYAKINWSLAVTGLRPDGYHLLDMVMETIGLSDTIVLSPAEEIGLDVQGDARIPQAEDNIVVKAARALRDAAGVQDGVRIGLTKRIPSGAGMGGGSADAAAVLRGLNRLWGLNWPIEKLARLALPLGADVPFCLYGGLARVRGIGEAIVPLTPGGMPLNLVVMQPDEGLSTPAVFRAYDAMIPVPENPDLDRVQAARVKGDLPGLVASLGNALERPAISMMPVVADCLQRMEEEGALRSVMTGSGSAVVGLFASKRAAEDAALRLRTEYSRCWAVQTVGALHAQ